jgi:hypothetical protein
MAEIEVMARMTGKEPTKKTVRSGHVLPTNKITSLQQDKCLKHG